MSTYDLCPRSILTKDRTREAAASLSETNPGHRSYTFDLDSLDNGADVPRDWRYSVDAHDHGKFICIKKYDDIN